jgi:hypothetical protein
MKILKNFFAFAIFTSSLCFSASGHDLPVAFVNAGPSQKAALEKALETISGLLSADFKAGLPQKISLKIEKLSDHTGIPKDLCDLKTEKTKRPFIYGEYNHNTHTLVLNTAVVNELMVNPDASPKINCQHKSLYNQAISTIVHELAHAYDFNDHNISTSPDFFQHAGFKQGLLKVKNKNIEAMRPADPYELQSSVEAFAVNLEYFTMDDEFSCRRPSMYDFLKSKLGTGTALNPSCSLNRSVMMSTNTGFYPMKLDPARIYRIDYLMAAPGKDLSSGFGHSMFRIITCAPERFDPITNKTIPATPFGKKCLEDRLFHLVVSYRANVEDATLNYLKGLTGGYPSMMFILNFGDVLDEYNRDELRDIVSYPLNLSAKEKIDFLNKVLEDHWNYRGSYKFVTNNCAVESYDLLKSALDRSQLNGHHSVSPKGVLEDLDRLEFVSIKSGEQESFKARTDQLLLAFKSAYGYKIKGDLKKDDKKDKEALLKFVKESAVESRKSTFNKFSESKPLSRNLHDEMLEMKERLVKASSFSVMEQQILRTMTADFRKKAADMFMNSKDEKIQELMKESGVVFKMNFNDLSTKGYGVPLQDEMVSRKDIEQKMTAATDAMANIEAALKEKMPEEFSILQSINENISLFNQSSLGIRKLYREKLEQYIAQVLKNLSMEDQGRTLLISSLSSKPDLDKVRQLLDSNLVSDKELLDIKLRKIITDTISN